MNLLSQNVRKDEFGTEKLYYFEKFETTNSILIAFSTMQRNGHIFSKFIINTDYDHTMDNKPITCNSLDILISEINRIGLIDVKDIFFECAINGQNVSGELAPDAGLIRIFLKIISNWVIKDMIILLKKKIKYAREEDVPEKTIFIITTDGMENASRSYTYEKVKSMIEYEKEKYGWEFIFLGANIDAAAIGARIGISEDRSVQFTNDGAGIKMNYAAMSDAISHILTYSKPLGNNWRKIPTRIKKSGVDGLEESKKYSCDKGCVLDV